QFLLFVLLHPKTLSDLWVMPLQGEKKPQPFLQSAFRENYGQISPDGHWVAYTSDESGQNETYVKPFPSGAGHWQISTNGGPYPSWRPDGKEIFSITPTNGLMAAEVRGTAGRFEYGAPSQLFDSQLSVYSHSSPYNPYAVSRNGPAIPHSAGHKDSL